MKKLWKKIKNKGKRKNLSPPFKLSKPLNIGVIGAGIQALSAAGTAGSQESELEKLMKSSKFDKFKNSWLGDQTEAFMEKVKG